MPGRPFIRSALRVGVLVCLCAFFWCCAYHRFTLESWKTPVEYGDDPDAGDVKWLFAAMKAVSEGHLKPLFLKTIPALGAPSEANWSDFPSGEEVLTYAAGSLVRPFGLFAAANLALLGGHILAALAFYAACRLSNYDWAWSMAGALVFAFSRYAFAHGLHHIALVYYWHVPLCLLVCRWTSTRRGLGGWRMPFALAVAVIAGVQNVYYTNMFLQLVLLGAFFQCVKRGWRAALPGAGVIAVAALTFLFMRTDTFAYRISNGPNPEAVERYYESVEYYALDVCALFTPPPDHRLRIFANHAQDYFSQTLVPGETPPASYLGLAGIAALIWLAVVSTRRMLRTPVVRGMPFEALQIIWILFYSTVGGLNAFVASLGFLLFRSTCRYSIFILAILLFFAVRRAPRRRWALALGVTALTLWDQSPSEMPDIKKTAGMIASDRMFTTEMEKRLAPGSMVFQMPIMDFPESPDDGLPSYDHFRPYLYSKGLRYSFGAVKGRSEWQDKVAGMNPRQQAAALENRGFSAIYLNRAGYRDKGEKLLGELKAEGLDETVQSPAGDLVCVLLKPPASSSGASR